MTFPTITLRVHPRCNHPKPEQDCIYCQDAHKVYLNLARIQEDTKWDASRVAVVRGDDGTSSSDVEDAWEINLDGTPNRMLQPSNDILHMLEQREDDARLIADSLRKLRDLLFNR